MNNKQQPLVTVVTPVHNGEAFLEECIASVVDQTYQNWEYVILNNASTDATNEIAAEFSGRDSRIRVVETDRLLPIMENWNLSMRQLSDSSVYCKVVHADDYLLPECLETMVEIGDRHPSAGIVGSYVFWGRRIGCTGLRREEELIPGPEICRRSLKREVYPFLSPSSLLIRSTLIRERDPFYRTTDLHADVQACYEVLRDHDFAFAHKILTYVRVHKGSTTSRVARPLNTVLPQNLNLLMEYGPEYLDDTEYRKALRIQLKKYQRFLHRNVNRRDKEFWDFHFRELASFGIRLSHAKLLFHKTVKDVSKKLQQRLQLTA